MKDLNRYIKESLLDDEDDLVDNDDSIIAKILNDPASDFRKTVWFKGYKPDMNIKYHDGVLDIDAYEMIFTNMFERNDYKLSDFCPGIKELRCTGSIRFDLRNVSAENICSDIKCHSIRTSIAHLALQSKFEGINFECEDIFVPELYIIKNCNINASFVRFSHVPKECKNTTINCVEFKCYDTFLTDGSLFEEVFDKMLDPTHTINIYDANKKSPVEFTPNKLKKIVAKIRNPKRYRDVDATPLIMNPDLYKFKKGKTGKAFLKELGFDKINSKTIAFSNNDITFYLNTNDPKDQIPFRLHLT